MSAWQKKYDLILIEDDVYGMLQPDGPPRLAVLSPARTVYISSCSKGLAPGLRVAFLRAPKPLAPALHRAVTLSCWMPPPLMTEVACRWMADGTADELIRDQQGEAAHRQAMAQRIFPDDLAVADPRGFHIWLSLPPSWTPEDFCAAAKSRGVLVTNGAAFAAGGRERPNAVRISLGCEPSRERVAAGLTILEGVLDMPAPGRLPVI